MPVIAQMSLEKYFKCVGFIDFIYKNLIFFEKTIKNTKNNILLKKTNFIKKQFHWTILFFKIKFKSNTMGNECCRSTGPEYERNMGAKENDSKDFSSRTNTEPFQIKIDNDQYFELSGLAAKKSDGIFVHSQQ